MPCQQPGFSSQFNDSVSLLYGHKHIAFYAHFHILVQHVPSAPVEWLFSIAEKVFHPKWDYLIGSTLELLMDVNSMQWQIDAKSQR